MKSNHNHPHPSGFGSKRLPGDFEFSHPDATTVGIAGIFNHWLPAAMTPLSASADKWWQEMFLAPGTYEYCLVVDGQWRPDPRAHESVTNPFGGRNSILNVAAAAKATPLSDPEIIPVNTDRFSAAIIGDHLVAEENLP